MQAAPGEKPRNSVTPRSSTIIIYTLLCFSLAGLISGFAFGGFLAHFSRKSPGLASKFATLTPISRRNPNLAATQAAENVEPGEPVIASGDYTSAEKADGATRYTLSVQAVNLADNTPITATDVTCRLWLTSDPNATAADLSANGYALPRTLASFSQPFPHEVARALNFASPSQQTQPCAAGKKTTWTYTISPSVPGGTYYLAVLTDWRGIHYNWYMVAIKILGQ